MLQVFTATNVYNGIMGVAGGATYIDRLKGRKGAEKSVRRAMKEICGAAPGLMYAPSPRAFVLLKAKSGMVCL